jgi:import inner membrane translocase subunit TIM44
MLSGSVRSPLRSSFVPAELRCSPTYTAQSRLFHLSSRLHQEKPQTEQKPSTAAPTDAKEKKPAEADAESEAKPEEEQSKKTEDGESAGKEGKEEGEGEGEGKDKEKKKEDAPPPPPHGDKTPWQVFMETMNTEFQKSQEWNESTKQIAASANQFAESEGVRRAREAYEKSTGAVSSTLGKGAKVTAGAIGKGASWTWDTSVVKGVRKAANVTGDAVDKATQPIRNTEAYKNVKNVIDDGSSSRYGGWVEKEERRKRREALDKQRGYKAAAPMEEDIK